MGDANVVHLVIGDGVTIAYLAISGDLISPKLETLTIRAGVAGIGHKCIDEMRSLHTIVFEGDMSTWRSIIGSDECWALGISATYVQCSDGRVSDGIVNY